MPTAPSPQLPFAHLNLRFNPFGELAPERWPEAAIVDVEPLVGMLGDGVALQLLGRCGRGKTTHLRALGARMGLPYVRLWTDREDQEREPAVAGPVRLIDEVDQVWIGRRWAAWRGARTLVLGTHRDLSAELRLCGFQPRTVRVGGADVDRVAAVVERRITLARRGPGPVPQVAAPTVAALVAHHGDDLRAICDVLYERFQQLESPDVPV